MWQEHVGVLHVHTLYSDGARCIAQVIGDARRAGLDFLVITDHDTLSPRREGWEGRHGDLEVIVGVEITPSEEGHMLAMRVKQCTGYASSPNRDTLDAIHAQGGYALVAHPMGEERRWPRIHQKPWRNWEHECIRGMEIWSYMHDWLDEVKWWRFPAVNVFSNHPERIVAGPRKAVLARWDQIGRTRRFAGVAGLDAHARRMPLIDVEIFPYDHMFHCLRNHFYLRADVGAADRRPALWEALAEGRGFVAHDGLADATGAECYAALPDGSRMMMGEEHAFASGAAMVFMTPRAAELRWIADGACRLKTAGKKLVARPTGPGVYRFEARLRGRPWIFTNPFYLRG